MKIVVKNAQGISITLEMSGEATIHWVKQQVEKVTGIQSNSQILILSGVELENDKKLEEYDIQMDSVLSLLTRKQQETRKNGTSKDGSVDQFKSMNLKKDDQEKENFHLESASLQNVQKLSGTIDKTKVGSDAPKLMVSDALNSLNMLLQGLRSKNEPDVHSLNDISLGKVANNQKQKRNPNDNLASRLDDTFAKTRNLERVIEEMQLELVNKTLPQLAIRKAAAREIQDEESPNKHDTETRVDQKKEHRSQVDKVKQGMRHIMKMKISNKRIEYDNAEISTKTQWHRDYGLAHLPVRLNTLERLKQDTELNYIRSGRFGKVYKFQPVAKKTIGAALGTIYEKEKTNPKKSEKKKSIWLGKVAVSDIDWGTKTKRDVCLKLSDNMNGSAILELIANNLYRIMGDGTYETPKTRVSEQPIEDEFTKDQYLARGYVNNYGIKRCLRVMSKWIDGYKNLSVLRVYDLDDRTKIIDFMDFIEKYHRPPEKVIDPGQQKEEQEEEEEEKEEEEERFREISVFGLMGVLSTATSMVDVDVLQTYGYNCGFVVEKDPFSEISRRIRIVKIDPGESFAFSKKAEMTPSEDKRDILYSTHAKYIGWKYLTENQKEEFIRVKHHHLDLIRDEKILKFIFFRDGKFLPQKIDEKLCEKYIKLLVDNIRSQEQVYSKSLSDFDAKKNAKESLYERGLTEARGGNLDRCLASWEQYYEFVVNKYGQHHEEVARMMVQLAQIQCFRGCYDKAKSWQDKGMKILKKINKEKSRWGGMLHTQIGMYFQLIENFEQAIEHLEKGKDLYEKYLASYNEDFKLSDNLMELGNAHHLKGDHKRSLYYYKRCLRVIKETMTTDEKSEEERETTKSTLFQNLGNVYYTQGQIEEATKYYLRGLEMKKKQKNPDHLNIATGYLSIGNICLQMKYFENAIEYYDMGLKEAEMYLPSNHPKIASFYYNIGIVHDNKFERKEAIHHLTKSLQIYKASSLPSDHVEIGQVHKALGGVFMKNGQLDAAIEHSKNAVKIFKKSKSRYKMIIAVIYQDLASIYLLKGDGVRADQYMFKGMFLKGTLEKNHIWFINQAKKSKDAKLWEGFRLDD